LRFSRKRQDGSVLFFFFLGLGKTLVHYNPHLKVLHQI